jgi:hypothetical protein
MYLDGKDLQEVLHNLPELLIQYKDAISVQDFYILYRMGNSGINNQESANKFNLNSMIKFHIPAVVFDSMEKCIKENKEGLEIYYGAAQWGVTRRCAQYFIEFEQTHPKFNKRMKKIQFPDEEYFHTIVHNSEFKYKCVAYDEPEQRWLVNWRNLHYFEMPNQITVFEQKDFAKIMKQEALFIRKVRSGISDELMDKIDKANNDIST